MAAKASKRQQAVLDCIERFYKEKGYGPTVREIGTELELSSPSTVHVHLKALERKGLITRDPHKSRSIVIASPENTAPDAPDRMETVSLRNVVDIPLVGNVAAGQPILAEENIEQMLTLPTEIVGDSASFVLRVRGDSMIEAGINDADYVVVKEQQTAENGDIVVALLDDGATVKRFFREKDRIRLQPENSSMKAFYSTDCTIAGKVVAVFRRVH